MNSYFSLKGIIFTNMLLLAVVIIPNIGKAFNIFLRKTFVPFIRKIAFTVSSIYFQNNQQSYTLFICIQIFNFLSLLHLNVFSDKYLVYSIQLMTNFRIKSCPIITNQHKCKQRIVSAVMSYALT